MQGHRLRAVGVTSCAIVATYAGLQLWLAHSVTTNLWWQSEWLRLSLRLQYPKVALAAQQPAPSWEAWLPSAVTACLLVGALAVAALLLVRSGRGWWLLLPATLPLIPTPLAPGVWAPALSSQVLYAIVWPPGATDPLTTWCWLAAAIDSLVVALPAIGLEAVVLRRRPRLYPGEVAARLLPLAVAGVAVIAWNHAAGEPPDWPTYALRAAWVLAGALLLSGGLPVRVTILALALLPALSTGLVRWSTAPGGHAALVYDPGAWATSVIALGGGAWVLAQPRVARALRRLADRWTAMVADMDEPVRRRDRAAPAGAGGRHRS